MNKYTVKKLPKSQVEILAEIPADGFAEFAQRALDEIAKSAEIPGFRKGTAPKEMVKAKIGEQKILDRAAVLAIDDSFPKAAAENNIEPLGYPQISILKLAPGNPFEYKAIAAVYPQTKLPDYKRIAADLEFKAPQVSAEDIKRLQMEKERHARQHWRDDLLEKLVKESELEIPDVLAAGETQKAMEDFKDRVPKMTGMDFAEYLKKIGKTEAQVQEDIAKDSETRIKKFLVLREIIKAEKIEVGDEEISAAIAHSRGEDGEDAGGAENEEQEKAYWRQSLQSEKAFEFLEASSKKS